VDLFHLLVCQYKSLVDAVGMFGSVLYTVYSLRQSPSTKSALNDSAVVLRERGKLVCLFVFGFSSCQFGVCVCLCIRFVWSRKSCYFL